MYSYIHGVYAVGVHCNSCLCVNTLSSLMARCVVSVLMCVVFVLTGHRRHGGKCVERFLQHSQERPDQSLAHFVDVFQPAQVAKLSAQERSTGETSLCYQC